MESRIENFGDLLKDYNFRNFEQLILIVINQITLHKKYNDYVSFSSFSNFMTFKYFYYRFMLLQYFIYCCIVFLELIMQ